MFRSVRAHSSIMRLLPRFISAGCNRIVNALDWGDNGLIAYAAASAVCIYDPEVRAGVSGARGAAQCATTAMLRAAPCVQPPRVVLRKLTHLWHLPPSIQNITLMTAR